MHEANEDQRTAWQRNSYDGFMLNLCVERTRRNKLRIGEQFNEEGNYVQTRI